MRRRWPGCQLAGISGQPAKARQAARSPICVIVDGYDGPQPLTGVRPMSDMRLIVAGAGGRMGRTLIQAIAETKGADARGRGRCAGLGRDRPRRRRACRPRPQRHHASAPTSSRCSPTPTACIDFTIPAATVAFAELTARHGRVHIIGTTGLIGEDEKLIAEAGQARRDRQVRQHEPRRQPARGADQARGARRSTRTSTSRSSRCTTTRRSMRRPAPR